jgi:hypothetical protein
MIPAREFGGDLDDIESTVENGTINAVHDGSSLVRKGKRKRKFDERPGFPLSRE